MGVQTRRRRGTRTARRRNRTMKIRHHHLLVRMESMDCPLERDKARVARMVDEMLKDISMKPLGATRVFYLNTPVYNQGLTAITPIQTSHLAFHFWNSPDKEIMNSKQNKCLLQFDLYTCGTLTLRQVCKLLAHLTIYNPRHVDVTILDRNKSLKTVKHALYDADKSRLSWTGWLKHFEECRR